MPPRQTNQATSHGSTRPRREQRQHPRGVDVGQERSGRVVRVAAVEPDADRRPSRPGRPPRRTRRGRAGPRPAARTSGSGAGSRAIRRGSCSRETSRRRARRKTPARRRVGRSIRSARSATIRPRPRADPGIGCSMGGSSGSAMAGRFSHALVAAPGPLRRRPGSRRYPHRQPAPKSVGLVTEGTVIIIGGAEDKVRERVILSRFVALAGGADAAIAVISTASSLGLEAGELYQRVFGELGVTRVPPLHAVTRAEANDEVGDPRAPRRDRHLPDRRQPAAPHLDDRRHAPGRRDPGALPARGRGRRHERRAPPR